MLQVQRPSSMPSTLLAEHHVNGRPYQLPQLKDFDGGWDKSARFGGGGGAAVGPRGEDWRAWPTASTTSRESSSSAQSIPSKTIDSSHIMSQSQNQVRNPQLPLQQYPGPQANQAPQLMYASTQQPSRPAHIRRSSRSSQPFYQSYYSARAPSPPAKKEVVPPGDRDQSTRRRNSADANTIASYLQIPPSINSSRGSLPEFAAQVTCLFWFETTAALQQIENPRYIHTISSLSPEAIPTLGFRKWVTTILSMTQVSQNVILLALMFIYRLKVLNPGVKGKVGSEFRLLTVALMLGNKFLDDNTYTNKTWADVSGISVQEIHVMEVEFLSNMRYSLYASEAEWRAWHAQLAKFADHLEKSTPSQREIEQSYGSPPNKIGKLPSPPISGQSFSPMPVNPSPPATMAPFLPQAILTPTSLPRPDSGARQWSRKRSLDEGEVEPPPKRMSTYIPSAPSSTLLTPAANTGDLDSPIPRLPAPVSTQHPVVQQQVTPGTHLPLPTTRAMASVYPTPARWPQNGHTTFPSPQYLPNSANAKSGSPSNVEMPSRPPSYGPVPAGLSPSGMPFPRNSPYKPVRGVNTLLVPPRSANVQRAPQLASFDQMHYQPLGKPISERRTGVLPWLPFETWSQSHHMHHQYLPQPPSNV